MSASTEYTTLLVQEHVDYWPVDLTNDADNHNHNDSDELNEFLQSRSKPTLTNPSQLTHFDEPKRTFIQQFASIYFTRLNKLRPIIVRCITEQTQNVSDPPLICERILNIEDGRECVVVGTLYKEMRWKPSILAEYNPSSHVHSHPSKTKKSGENDASKVEEEDLVNYCHESDEVLLEDETGRLFLIEPEDKEEDTSMRDEDHPNIPISSANTNGTKFGTFDRSLIVSGVIAGIQGRTTPRGKFVVSAIYYASFPPQNEKSPLSTNQNEKPFENAKSKTSVSISSTSSLSFTSASYCMFVSDICMGLSLSPSSLLRTQLLFDYIKANIGNSTEQKFASRISTVVFAGNLLETPPKKVSKFGLTEEISINDILASLSMLDAYLNDLSKYVNVVIMPGENDATNISWPQKRFHRYLLPSASKVSSFTSLTNPSYFSLNSLSFLGTSGSNVTNIRQYSNWDKPIDVLEQILQWRHIAPTAPDTLPCYPYQFNEPFIIQSLPHVFFAGNQPSFETRLLKNESGQLSRLISIPSFSKKGEVCLMNMTDPHLNTTSMQIGFDV